MNNPNQVLLAMTAAAFVTGCCSIKAYFADRTHDALDVLTVTTGVGLGTKAKAGPFATGLLISGDLMGLRGGELFASPHARGYSIWSPVPLSFVETGAIGGIEDWDASQPDVRNKEYEIATRWPFVISDFFYSEGDASHHDKMNVWTNPVPYQIEAGLGIGVSVQIGANPAELLDLFLGFAGIDIFLDDKEMLKFRRESNQTTQAIRLAANVMRTEMK